MRTLKAEHVWEPVLCRPAETGQRIVLGRDKEGSVPGGEGAAVWSCAISTHTVGV